jgi:hypothetical protein
MQEKMLQRQKSFYQTPKTKNGIGIIHFELWIEELEA